MSNKGIEFSFGWIFAVLVGAVILFLALYAASNFITLQRQTQNAQTGLTLSILLNPMETNLEEGQRTIINLPMETRLYTSCNSNGVFGSQDLRVSTKSGVGAAWESPGNPSTFSGRYFFFQNPLESKKYYYVLSKSFNMPFKIADLIFLFNDNNSYCFVNPPNEIKNDIMQFNIPTLVAVDAKKNCSAKSTTVCFSESKCDIDVDIDAKSVRKNDVSNGSRVYYEGSLVYAAILMDQNVYECQIKRLMKRASEIGEIYETKTVMLSSKGCSSGLEGDLAIYKNITAAINNSIQLKGVVPLSQDIEHTNNGLSCKLF